MASRKEAQLIALACKQAGVQVDTLLSSAVYEDDGLVVIIIATGQKFKYNIAELEDKAKKSPPPKTTRKVGKRPETTDKL